MLTKCCEVCSASPACWTKLCQSVSVIERAYTHTHYTFISTHSTHRALELKGFPGYQGDLLRTAAQAKRRADDRCGGGCDLKERQRKRGRGGERRGRWVKDRRERDLVGFVMSSNKLQCISLLLQLITPLGNVRCACFPNPAPHTAPARSESKPVRCTCFPPRPSTLPQSTGNLNL